MVKSNLASSSHSPEPTKPSNQEVALRVASCNLKLDLDLNKYDPTLHIMLEFLKSHPIQKPLTKSTEFPLSIIHTAYSTAVYNSKEEYIEFNVNEDKTTKLCKNEFLKAIGLPQSKKEKKTFYEPTNDELFDVLDQMGYLPPRLEKHTDFKKGKLPAMWQFLVHIMLRCLSGKVGGTDTMNKPFLVLLIGMYTGKEVDLGTTIWKDFASYVFPKKKDVPCARFWALALQKGYAKKGYTKLKSPLPEGEEMFNTRIISRFNIADQSEFGPVARLPDAMLRYIDKNSEVLIKYREDTVNLPESSQPIRSTGDTSSPKCKKQVALKEKKTNGVGTKRKCETTLSPQGKRQLTQTKLPFQKVKDVEKSPKITVVSQSQDHTTRPEAEENKEDEGKEEMVRTAVKLLEQAMCAGPFTKTADAMKEDCVVTTNENREELEKEVGEKEQLGTTQLGYVVSESREVEAKKKEKRKELVRMLWGEQQRREDEEMVRTAAQLLERAMSEGHSTETGEVSAQAMEEDFVFTADEGRIRDSESPPSVKPSKCRVFVGTSETESEHIENITKNIPTIAPGTSTPFRRAKGKQKKKSTYVSRVEFDSLNEKLSEVLDVVKKIPPSEEKYVTKEDFGEMQKTLKSLAQSFLNLETRETNLRESILNSTADALRDMEQKRTADTFKYLDRMDEMVKMVKEIQQSYDDFANTMAHQHKDEIVRVSEQLCDYRNKNIILQAVLVKVMQSTQLLRFDEVVSLIQKVQNSVDALPKTLSNDDLSEQAQQSFSKVFEMLHDLKGMKFVDEAGPSSTKGRQNENVDEVSEPQPPPIITIPPTEGEIHEPPPPPPKIPTPSTSFLMPLFKIACPIKDKGKMPIEVSEVSAMKTSPVSENEKLKEDVQETANNEEQRALTPYVDVIRKLRDDELVPKQTTSPPSSDEYQWDIPMSPNVRYYSVFQPLHTHLSREMKVPIEMDRLEKFFKAHAQPSKNVWSLRRITRVMGYKKMCFQKFEYFYFEVVRSDNKEYSFSEADFPNLNPNDLYIIGRHFQNKLVTHEPSRSPFIQIQKFLRCLVYDLGNIDAERFDGFVDDPPKEINQELDGIENRHRGPTEDPELGIIYSNEKDSPRLFFRLRQKHLCKTEFLKEMIDLTLRSRKASEGLKVRIIEEMEWWIAVRKWIKRVTDLVTNKI